MTPASPDPRAVRADLQAKQAAHRPAVAHLLRLAARLIRPANPAPTATDQEARDA